MTNEQAVAATILEQLGGNRFLAMTNARNVVALDSRPGVMFNIGRNARGINKVRIELTDADLYDVKYYRIRKLEATTVASSEGIYADMLRGDFESKTGMYCTL